MTDNDGRRKILKQVAKGQRMCLMLYYMINNPNKAFTAKSMRNIFKENNFLLNVKNSQRDLLNVFKTIKEVERIKGTDGNLQYVFIPSKTL